METLNFVHKFKIARAVRSAFAYCSEGDGRLADLSSDYPAELAYANEYAGKLLAKPKYAKRAKATDKKGYTTIEFFNSSRIHIR